MKKSILVTAIIGIMILSNIKVQAQCDALSHSRVNGYYVGWNNAGTSGTLEIKNDFASNINFSTNGSQRATILSGGNFGIGTTAPNEQLEITKNFRLPATTGSTIGVIYSGANSYIHNYGTNNFFAGVSSGNFSMSGTNNVGIGYNTLNATSTGNYNVAVGASTLSKNTEGDRNTAVGYQALMSAASVNDNDLTAIGYQALYNFSGTSGLTAIGSGALYTLSTNGGQNVAIGYQSLYSCTDNGIENTAVGSNSLYYNGAGARNTVVGDDAMYWSTGGDHNTAMGSEVAAYNDLGSYNCVFGSNAGLGVQNVSDYSNNSFFGYSSGYGESVQKTV